MVSVRVLATLSQILVEQVPLVAVYRKLCT
jgi:hypothetical protein